MDEALRMANGIAATAPARCRERGVSPPERPALRLSKFQAVDQRMRWVCSASFRQLQTCRRIRSGQLCARIGHGVYPDLCHRPCDFAGILDKKLRGGSSITATWRRRSGAGGKVHKLLNLPHLVFNHPVR